MINKLLLLLAIALCTLSQSCMPEPLETDINPEADKLVINSSLTINGHIWVSVTKSNGTIKSGSTGLEQLNQFCVRDAVVTIVCNGLSDTLQHKEFGVYTSDKLKLEPGQTYLLKAFQKSTGKTVIASSTMPEIISVQNYKAQKLKNFGDSAIKVIVELNANPLPDSYYMSYVYPLEKGGNNNGIFNERVNPLFKEIFKTNPTIHLYTDANERHGKIQVISYLPHTFLNDTIKVMASCIEKGYYHFLDLQKKSGTLLNRSTGDPFRLYGNIENGYGYFSLNSPKLISIYPTDIQK
jgi:hypothetical protein